MQYVSSQKYARVTPRKMREVVYLARQMKPSEAVVTLPFSQKKASVLLGKVIKTAVANAVAKGANESELRFREIQVSDGPRLKRYRAGSRGAARPYAKRLSHIRIVLEVPEESASKEKKESTKKTASPALAKKSAGRAKKAAKKTESKSVKGKK